MRIVTTPGGKRRLLTRLATVRAEYDAVIADNPTALEAGDNSGWHDNFAFEENQRRMHQLARRLRELERVRDRAEVVPPLGEAPERVVLGARICFRFLDEGEEAERVLWLAGYEDGEPGAGRVSYDSPLGRALLGAEEGDHREVVQGGVPRVVEILELGPTPDDDDAREAATSPAGAPGAVLV